jgi:hypothetical protein
VAPNVVRYARPRPRGTHAPIQPGAEWQGPRTTTMAGSTRCGTSSERSSTWLLPPCASPHVPPGRGSSVAYTMWPPESALSPSPRLNLGSRPGLSATVGVPGLGDGMTYGIHLPQ